MISLEAIQNSLAIANFDVLKAHQIMMPMMRSRQRPAELLGRPRIGAVLLLLYHHQNEFHVVLTKRREDLNSHAGQISFPGGSQENDESLQNTALRETHEEIGVPQTAVTILGQLSPLYIPPSDFEVHPFVGWVHTQQQPQFIPQASEVAQILEVPLTHLFNPTTIEEELHDFRGQQIMVPFFNVEGHKVWGATAMMLSEFLQRIKTQRSTS